MTINEFQFTEDNHFIAMEYYALVLNRTFLVLLHQGQMIGLKANGLISAQGGNDPLTFAITSAMSINGELENPYSYIRGKFLNKLNGLDILGEDILNTSNCNFRLATKDIMNVTHNPNKKWGMGPYPHDGRVIITTRDQKSREFIILGAQSGQKVSNLIKANR